MKLSFLFGKNHPPQAESESEKDLSAKQTADLSEHVDTDYAAGQIGVEDSLIRGLSDLYVPEESRVLHERDIADALLEMGKITDQQHAHVRQEQLEKPGSDAATWLLKDGLINTNDVLMAKAKLYDLEFRQIRPEDVQQQAFQKLD
ncbi:MAG: hypothetical protein ACETVZ_03905, partial [Phycisphaerae bacterium]